MNADTITRLVTLAVIENMVKIGSARYVPAAISARHMHLCQAHIDTLFGRGHTLKSIRDLVQPQQFACAEQVALVGKKGRIEGIRVLGPAREDTQVEISMTDCIKTGIDPVVRMSGDIKNTPGGTLIGPAGQVELKKGVIVSARHLHATDEQAAWFGLKNGDVISVKKTGDREIIFGSVVVRTGKAHQLELHLDTDEANAACIGQSELLEIIR